MAPTCHVSVEPVKTIEEELRKSKMCKKLLLSDLVFN